MTRRRWLLGLVGTGVLLVAVVATGIGLHVYADANASTPTAATTLSQPGAKSYCQLYLNTLAADLHTTTASLESANSAAIKTVLAQMVTDHKITSAQEATIEQRIASASAKPCAFVPPIGALGHHGRPGSKALAGARGALEQAVAGSLGISVTQLQQDLKNGESVATIAGANLSAAKSAYLAAVKTQLGDAVSKSLITSAQETKLYNTISTAVGNGHFPLLDHPARPAGPPLALPQVPQS